MAKCKLCSQERILCKSHIIPEFFYKSMYDSKHRMIYASNLINETVKFRFKGVYENLLCRECEEKINKFETYITQQLTNRSNVEYYEDEKVIIYGNWDYLNFKLFALSVLWRASISKNHLFRDVDIGTNEEIIRNMILINIPGKFDLYPILMVAITSCNKQTAFDLVTNPDLINVYGRWAYRFVFGGFVWLFLFGDTSNFPMRRLFFQPEGTIIIPKREMDDINFLVEFSFELYRQGKLALSLDSLKQ